MKRGNFKTFVDLISPLAETYGDFSIFVTLFNPGKSYDASPEKEMLPLYGIETNETDQKEVCFMVRGLGETEDADSAPPLDVNEFIKQISTIKETCEDHIIVLAQKDIVPNEEDDEYDRSDYITFHLPTAEIKTSSEDDKKRFFLMIIPFNDGYEHVHYGIINDPDSEGLIYKNEHN
jgi:hypothetical protein